MKTSVILIMLSASIMMSCTSPKMLSVQNNIGNLKQKGDYAISPSAMISSGNNVGATTGNLNAAYAITDEIGIYSSNSLSVNNSGKPSNLFGFEVGMGKFKQLSSRHNSELIGGIGYSSVKTNYSKVDSSQKNIFYNIQSSNVYIQYNIIYEYKKFFATISPRINFVRLLKVDYNQPQLNVDREPLDFLSNNRNLFYFEPAFEVGFKFNVFSIYLQNKWSLATHDLIPKFDGRMIGGIGLGMRVNYNYFSKK